MSKFLGEPIEEGVAEQLSVRGDIMSSRNRTPEEIRYLSSRTGWVRLTSGVDTENGADDSKQLILQGGAGYYNSTEDKLFLKSGVSFDNNVQDSTKVYNTTGQFGTRPMPGITNFSVKCKGRFGSIKETVVSFNVWSLEDLERVEKLFFRLGYTCIVEWGNSIYVDNDGTVTNAGLTVNYNNFFDSSTREKAQEIINKQKANTSYNYDGLIGLIKNFSWGFRSDGGYDCTLSIISLGEIIESLKVDKAPLDLEPLPTLGKEANSAKPRASYFHLLNYGLSSEIPADGKSYYLNSITKPSVSRLVENLTIPETEGGLGKGPIKTVGFEVITDRTEGSQEGESTKVFYITLRTLLGMLNRFYLLKVQGRTEPRFDISLKGAPKFNTHKGHYSSDPCTCLLPSNPSDKRIDNLSLEELYEGETDIILNIPVSIPYIIEAYKAVTSNAEAEAFSLFDFVQRVISGIQDSLGRINDFDIVYDDTRRLFSIVDRRKIDTEKSKIPELDLVGLRTTVSSLKIESKISSRLGSQIAIAAQASPESYTRLLSNLVKWNEGKIDRFAVTKSDNIQESNSELQRRKKLEAQQENFRTNLANLYSKLNKFDPTKKVPGLYSDEEWTDIQKGSFEEQIRANTNLKVGKKSPLQGIIPIDISFTMDGIAGLKIGESVRFKKGFLLPKYETFSYIITGIDHSIGADNRWITELKFNPIIYP